MTRRKAIFFFLVNIYFYHLYWGMTDLRYYTYLKYGIWCYGSCIHTDESIGIIKTGNIAITAKTSSDFFVIPLFHPILFYPFLVNNWSFFHCWISSYFLMFYTVSTLIYWASFNQLIFFEIQSGHSILHSHLPSFSIFSPLLGIFSLFNV